MSWDYQEYTIEDIEALIEWPCQDTWGGRMPFADRNFCQHTQCHPRNSPEYEAQQQSGWVCRVTCDVFKSLQIFCNYCWDAIHSVRTVKGTKTMNDETITISAETYKELVAAQNFLEALQGCGVDNWEGYDMAQEMYQEMYQAGQSDD